MSELEKAEFHNRIYDLLKVIIGGKELGEEPEDEPELSEYKAEKSRIMYYNVIYGGKPVSARRAKEVYTRIYDDLIVRAVEFTDEEINTSINNTWVY